MENFIRKTGPILVVGSYYYALIPGKDLSLIKYLREAI